MINVLVVDDDAMVAELNRCYLNQISGFSCCGTVSTLQQAKNRILQDPPDIDLVLLDVYMQQENGLDLLPIIREFCQQIDVIVISSASDAATIKKALQYGVVDYLIKPFQFSRFEEALGAYREKKTLLEQHDCYQQSDVDRLLRRTDPQATDPEKLPKGLTVPTLRTVCEWIDSHPDIEFSTDNLAAAIGISRVSCRKYLIYLTQTKILTTHIQYGVTGRPVYLYHLLPLQQSRLKQHCVI
ncbi:two-component system response regulator DcuR [Biostraticola tofi]|uniref:Transcriptional regulatory protein n=1 Tax=Biostraticola tofi TaxID=466109 RepID=A0A4R3YTZ3_9GAMM|nr:two-component system response regulator DcuR [Biostraticola tofi]TCV95198.1 two-component system response regulator DcuR [Biostraticola tofi]